MSRSLPKSAEDSRITAWLNRVWHKHLWAVVHRTTCSEDLVVLQFFCKSTKGMTGDSSRMMIDLKFNNSWPIKRVREGTMFLVLSPASCDDCLYLWGMLGFWIGLDILVVHRATGYECSGGPTYFLVVSDHCQLWTLLNVGPTLAKVTGKWEYNQYLHDRRVCVD